MDLPTHIALFAGDGGGELALQHFIQLRTVCYVEKGRLQQKTLIQRIKDGLLYNGKIWDDVTTFNGYEWRGLVDVISAGFPCQGYSAAGKKLGAKDPRNLWPDTIRIIGEIGPELVILENVADLLSFGYYGDILRDLSESGYDARWETVSSFEVGAPHPRERLWVIAHPHNGRRESTSGVKKVQSAQQRRQSNGCAWWKAEPEIRRVDDGLARGVGRQLEPLGEGQVPHVLAEAWLRMVSEKEEGVE